ncbi:MAG: HAD-IA family hydrolase [Candidatus Heimdallarchaeota archaeon]|nr:HAD-IA family hydrolase [Candidatus Heimdallarchaeota archaeon]
MQPIVTLQEILEKKDIKAFVFDLDGTLIDSQIGIAKTVSEFLQKKGHEIGEEKIMELFGTPLEVVLCKLVPGLSESEAFEYLKEIRKVYAKHHTEITTLFPGVQELLQGLKMKGFKVAIASTKYKPLVEEIVVHFKLDEYIDVIVSGYEVANHKPAPDILFETAKRLHLHPTNCIYIGDSPSDIVAGKEAGTVTIAVLTGSHSEEKFIKIQPDFLIKKIANIQLVE